MLIAGPRRSRARAWGIVSNLCFAIAGISCLVILVVSLQPIGQAIRAAPGHGVVGMFTAQDQYCTRVCTWTGTFRSPAHGIVLHGAGFDDAVPRGTRSGSSFPGLWPGGSNDVYAMHGSTAWLQFVLWDVLACGVLAALAWYGPIRYLRERRRPAGRL